MGGRGSGRKPSEETLVKRQREQFTPVGDSLFLPNHSGEHRKGIIRDTPINDVDLVNKKYVDDSTPTNYWTTDTNQTGLTGNKTGSFDIDTSGEVIADDGITTAYDEGSYSGDPPYSDTDIYGAFGLASTKNAGWTGIMYNTSTDDFYIAVSDGTQWLISNSLGSSAIPEPTPP